MTSSRRRWLGWLALALLAAFILLLLPRRGAHDRFVSICNGMTAAEVKGMLGPPGEYRSRPGFIAVGPRHILLDEEERQQGPFTLEIWYFDEGVIEILFNRHGQVAGKQWWQEPARPSWVERLRSWLGW